MGSAESQPERISPLRRAWTLFDELRAAPDSLLNPRNGCIPTDVVDYLLQPMVCVPHLLVFGLVDPARKQPTHVGLPHNGTAALPLSACRQSEWIVLAEHLSRHTQVLARGRDDVIMIGGSNGARSTLYSVRSNRWRDGPVMPFGRRSFGAVTLGVAGYGSLVCGGWDGTSMTASVLRLPPEFCERQESDLGGSSTGWLGGGGWFGGGTAQWQAVASLPQARSNAGAALVGGDHAGHTVALVGGQSGNDGCRSSLLFDAVADRWTPLAAQLPLAGTMLSCASSCVSVANGAVLALDGTYSLLLDARCSSWTSVRRPEPRWSACAVALDACRVALLGGLTSSDDVSQTVQIWDARSDCWVVNDDWALPTRSSLLCCPCHAGIVV